MVFTAVRLDDQERVQRWTRTGSGLQSPGEEGGTAKQIKKEWPSERDPGDDRVMEANRRTRQLCQMLMCEVVPQKDTLDLSAVLWEPRGQKPSGTGLRGKWGVGSKGGRDHRQSFQEPWP